MDRYYSGMVVRTSYGTGPYEITGVTGNCTCPSFLDSLEYSSRGETPPPSKPHFHLTCRCLGDKRSEYYLNGYDENGNSAYSDNDRIIVCAEETLFLTMCCNL